ncbi:hypothetical protein [Marimonas arenosa]|uniref:Uncharacterized protein n=1 Tax=Marimonas arenosa TaxID=1795305 RepID=A0AAE3W9Y0_9RHOB|nr:hypothetical protein [Marimonas arenosa]MDQ2088842.1 hypothetical protein [Marimonas arenosa]
MDVTAPRASEIKHRIASELHDYDPDAGNLRSVGQVVPMPPDWHRLLLKEFREALIEPEEVETLFSGGMTATCWAVTRSTGAYRVLYIPWAKVFSLAVESRFGPVDIGVHGDAISVFGSIH